MSDNNIKLLQKEIKRLSMRFWVVIFFLTAILSVGIIVLPDLYYKQMVSAQLSGDYTKGSGSVLTANDWNNLLNDFVRKSGDIMTGDLTFQGSGIVADSICLSDGTTCMSPDLVNNQNTEADCINTSGGQLYTVAAGNICRFNQSSCPNGFFQYQNWSANSNVVCTADGQNCTLIGDSSIPCRCRNIPDSTCDTSAHIFSDNARKECTVSSGSNASATCRGLVTNTCYATVTAVGCY